MRLAILVCGEYREFEQAHRSWDFLTKTDNDVFFSTWDKSIQENKGLDIYIEEEITEDKIKKYLPNAFISIVDSDVNASLPNNTHRMHYHWKNAFKVLEESGNNYTHIILIRPDNFYHNYTEDYNTFDIRIKPDRLYGNEKMCLTGKNEYSIDDTFFLGTFDVIKKFITNLPMDTPMHQGLAQYVLKNDWFIEDMNLSLAIIRANCRGLENIDLNIVGQKRHEWYLAYHKHKENEN